MSTQNKYTKKLDVLKETEKPELKHYEQLFGSVEEVLADINSSFNVNSYRGIRDIVANRTVKKETLCEFLETACCLLREYAVPLLVKDACEIKNLRINTSTYEKTFEKTKDKINGYKAEIAKFQKEKIVLQESVITLQNKVIESQEKYLKSVQSTVQTTVQSEMKSYASALTKTCSAALAPKKIRAVIKTVADKEDRSRNLIMYGISEPGDGQEVLSDKVSEVLLEIGEKPVVRNCCRLGMVNNNTPRPVKLSCNNSDIVNQVLRKAKLLRTKEGYNSVYISPDRTVDERRAYKKLWEEVKEKRKSETDKVHVIKNNKVVSFDKNSNLSAEPDKT